MITPLTVMSTPSGPIWLLWNQLPLRWHFLFRIPDLPGWARGRWHTQEWLYLSISWSLIYRMIEFFAYSGKVLQRVTGNRFRSGHVGPVDVEIDLDVHIFQFYKVWYVACWGLLIFRFLQRVIGNRFRSGHIWPEDVDMALGGHIFQFHEVWYEFDVILTIAKLRDGTTRVKPPFEKYLRCPVTKLNSWQINNFRRNHSDQEAKCSFFNFVTTVEKGFRINSLREQSFSL